MKGLVSDRWRAVAFGVVVHSARFGIIVGVLEGADALGVSGWYLGLVVNLACVVFAVVLVSVRGLWRASGLLVLWRGRTAVLFLVPLLVEVVLWAAPAGLEDRPPGFGLWALTLFLVGVNEELVGRVVVLERLRTFFPAPAAVAIAAALFGMQHLSALVTTRRGLDDVLFQVLVTAAYGAALAAFQYRFRWIGPIILLHASVDFTSILAPAPLPDLVVVLTVVMFIALAVIILRGRSRDAPRAPAVLPRTGPPIAVADQESTEMRLPLAAPSREWGAESGGS